MTAPSGNARNSAHAELNSAAPERLPYFSISSDEESNNHGATRIWRREVCWGWCPIVSVPFEKLVRAGATPTQPANERGHIQPHHRPPRTRRVTRERGSPTAAHTPRDARAWLSDRRAHAA